MSQTVALAAHRFYLRAGLSAIHAFSWVFVWQYYFVLSGDVSQAFLRVVLLYALAQVVAILATPLAARALVRGARALMLAAILVLAAAFLVWAATLAHLIPTWGNAGVIIFAVLLGLYRALYWVPYAVEKERVVANKVPIPAELFIAIMPALAGLSLSSGPLAPVGLLAAGAAIILMSVIPLARVREVHESYTWGYGQALSELIEPRYRTFVLKAFIEGIEGAALLLLWPLAVFLIVAKSYSLFGFVLTITLLLAIPTRILARKYLPTRPAIAGTLAASAWLLRLIVATPFAVVCVDTYAFANESKRESLDIYALEQGADNSTYVDELTVLKEIALGLGRLVIVLIAGLLTAAFWMPLGITITFIIAAACAAYSFRLAQRKDGRMY
jgi:hypothetical protein